MFLLSKIRALFLVSLIILVLAAFLAAPKPLPNWAIMSNSGSSVYATESTVSFREAFSKNGICYGPFRDGQNPDVELFPTAEQVREDLIALQNITTFIRTYSSRDIHTDIPSIANDLGLNVCQGVCLSSDFENNEAEINVAAGLAKQGLAKSVIVGNEVLLADVLSEDELIHFIRLAKQSIPDEIPVTTADSWSVWLDHPNLVEEVDYIMIHVHPFWENQPIDKAATYVIECYTKVKEKYPNISVVIGETGWPSGGDTTWAGVSPETVPNEANQKRFIEEFVALAAENSVKYFFFEAFDEEWKWTERMGSGNIDDLGIPNDRTFSGFMPGSSWGLFTSSGELKPQLSGLFGEVPSVSSRMIRDILVEGRLYDGYDMGVDSSGDRTDWLIDMNDSMCMDYPAGQSWGVVFVTVGEPVEPPRPWKNFSEFQTISVDLRGQLGGESVEIGIKDAYDPDEGRETRIEISDLGTTWQTYTFSLSSFETASLPNLYVVAEFVFSGSQAQTVYFRNIRYLP